MGALGVVVVGEFVEEALQFADGGCWGFGGYPFFECLVEALNFALGLGVSWAAVFLLDAVLVEGFLECVAPTFCPG